MTRNINIIHDSDTIGVASSSYVLSCVTFESQRCLRRPSCESSRCRLGKRGAWRGKDQFLMTLYPDYHKIVETLVHSSTKLRMCMFIPIDACLSSI